VRMHRAQASGLPAGWKPALPGLGLYDEVSYTMTATRFAGKPAPTGCGDR